jgi:hypothetical protein
MQQRALHACLALLTLCDRVAAAAVTTAAAAAAAAAHEQVPAVSLSTKYLTASTHHRIPIGAAAAAAAAAAYVHLQAEPRRIHLQIRTIGSPSGLAHAEKFPFVPSA